MKDSFDRFLAESLAPAEREPDRAFVGRVQAVIAIEERLASARAAILRRLGLEILAVLAVGTGVLWLGRAPEVTEFAGQSPWLAAGAMMAGFGLLVAVLGASATGRGAACAAP